MQRFNVQFTFDTLPESRHVADHAPGTKKVRDSKELFADSLLSSATAKIPVQPTRVATLDRSQMLLDSSVLYSLGGWRTGV